MDFKYDKLFFGILLFAFLITIVGLQVATFLQHVNQNDRMAGKVQNLKDEFEVYNERSSIASRSLDSLRNDHNVRNLKLDTAITRMTDSMRNPYTLQNLGKVGSNEIFRLQTESHDADVDYTPFSEACVDAATSDEKFAIFRRNPYVIDMLEHVETKYCPQYMAAIHKMSTAENIAVPWSIVLQNDAYGTPERVPVDLMSDDGSYIHICPTTLRYVFLGLKQLCHVRRLGLSHIDIVEIGGGYGGQCAITHALTSIFGIEVTSYTILDLPNVNLLQRKFLSAILPAKDTITCTTVNDGKIPSGAFLYSVYAYSEISEEVQNLYNMALQGRIAHGFVLWNSIRSPTQGFWSMISKSYDDVTIQVEVPRTGPFNFIYTF